MLQAAPSGALPRIYGPPYSMSARSRSRIATVIADFVMSKSFIRSNFAMLIVVTTMILNKEHCVVPANRKRIFLL
jgi:hypothetical protein